MVPRLVADRLVLLNCPPPSCRCFASNGLFDDLPLWCRDERVADVGGAGQDLPLQIHVDGDGDPYVVACCHLPFCNARPLTNHALFNTGFSFSSNRAPLPLLPSPSPAFSINSSLHRFRLSVHRAHRGIISDADDPLGGTFRFGTWELVLIIACPIAVICFLLMIVLV